MTMTIDDVKKDLEYAISTLHDELRHRRYEDAAHTADMIAKLARAADRMTFCNPPAVLTIRDVYGN